MIIFAIGLVVPVLPTLWLGLFSRDSGVLATGARYLRIVGPLYGAVGLGMLLYFASQSAGRVLLPFVAGTARLSIAAGPGWLIVARLEFGLAALFVAVAAAALFGAINALAGPPFIYCRCTGR